MLSTRQPRVPTSVLQTGKQSDGHHRVHSITTDKAALILDALASHDDVDDEQLLLIALPPNTTAVFEPLDDGVIQSLKMRNKKMLLAGVVHYLDAGSEAPRSTSRTTVALANSGRTTMLYVARIVAEEWAAMTLETPPRCWPKARCLPVPYEADITRLHSTTIMRTPLKCRLWSRTLLSHFDERRSRRACFQVLAVLTLSRGSHRGLLQRTMQMF